MTTVVSRSARRRWATVAAGTAVLVAALGLGPPALSALGVGAATTTPAETVRRALGSSGVAFSAVGESRGNLALPDLSGFGGLASLLGDTTRTRVWWSDPGHWRVDVVGVTGETDTYGLPSSITTWDYESRRLVTVAGDPSARLPRADDLLAPQAARRLLGSVGPQDRLEALPAERVGGRVADGVRVVPGDARSTLAHADVWVDRATGLPLKVVLTGVTGGDALVSTLGQVDIGRPDAAVLTPPAPAIARRDFTRAADPIARVAGRIAWARPDSLAGLPLGDAPVQGVATYGTGLVRVAVLPLPRRLARDVVANATKAGSATAELNGGTVVRIGSSLLNVALAEDDETGDAYVLAGLVTPAVLDEAAVGLFASPSFLRSSP